MKDKDTQLLAEAVDKIIEGQFLPGTDIPNEAEWGKEDDGPSQETLIATSNMEQTISGLYGIIEYIESKALGGSLDDLDRIKIKKIEQVLPVIEELYNEI